MSCSCTGIRRCGLCSGGAAAPASRWGDFGSVDDDTVWMCPRCNGRFYSSTFVVDCRDHEALRPCNHPDFEMDGFMAIFDFISEAEESSLIQFLDVDSGITLAEGGWKDSQSGRRKQDFGPAANFKQKKCKLRPGRVGFPQPLHFLLKRVSRVLSEWTLHPDDARREFLVAEASSLDYQKSAALSSLDPHIDDQWLWGERIAGVSLLSTAAMTFVRRDATLLVALPRRAMFAICGPARHEWLHGISNAHIPGRRVSITIREFSHEARSVASKAGGSAEEHEANYSLSSELSIAKVVSTLDEWHRAMV